MNLENFDLKLIEELENDSRQTLSKIAKKLRTSQQVVSYRIDSLFKKNILGGFYTIINFSLLGYTNYRTMMRLTDITKQKHQQIISYLMKHPNVLWIVDCGGRWDLIINFIAKNILQYDQFIKELKKRFPKQIQNYNVLTTVEISYFGRHYFTKNIREKNSPLYFGREIKIIETDKTDLKILSLLSENARMNSVQVAEKLKISPNTILLRIKDMKNKNLIQGFKPLLHLENTAYSAYKALIKFHNITDKREKDIFDYLRTKINVIGIIKIIGEWDFEMEFEVNSQQTMLDFMREFRDKFKDVINEFEVIPLFHEYKYNFFPGELVR
ncbi:MAG: winged helix-turn-helix transcriptional regulator [Nanoarchaeota archaeon]